MNELENKVVIVTGGAQGIGRGIAARFLDAGASVVVADADAEALQEISLEHSATDPAIHAVQCDVSSEDDVKNLVENALGKFGQIDFVINNAGIGVNKPLETLELSDWNRVIGVNLTGAFLMAKHASPHLRKVRGAMVNIASTRAVMSEANTEAYSASKGGLLALTHALAISLGPDVRVNAVSPGWIETRDRQKKSVRSEVHYSDADLAQHPVGRVGTPEDIAAMVLFLCSSDSGFVTGQNFVVDGGMTKKMIYVE
jgi:NAD(P)-dependent dehydrogenase (short-subunit alcohol dehydrogenase family)